MNKRQAKKLKQRTVYIALTKQIFCIRTWRDVKLEKRYYKECDKQDKRIGAYTK